MFPSIPWLWTATTTTALTAGAESRTPTPTVTARRGLAEQLLHYHHGAKALPPSARVVPDKKQQRAAPLGIVDLWRYGAFLAYKATEVATDVVRHHVYGPRRKSWGIEMTVISSFMRDMGTRTHLTDINMLRMLMQLGGMVPLPSDALVTPVTFRVRRRGLRGILAAFDRAEPGTRELSGEWVVGKALWHRLNAQWKARRAAAVAAAAVDPALGTGTGTGTAETTKHRVILFLHGGAYYLFSAATHRLITIPLSKYTEARVFALDYRLAPETRFPGPLHDAVSAYFRLTDDLGIPPENILIAGDSAGGALATALLMYLRDNDYPTPAGAMLFSPWVDLTMSCDSWDSNAAYDIVPRPISGDHLDPIGCYLGDDIQKYLTHPYASPLFGDFAGLPPLLVQAGEAEVLRDEITLFAHKATLAGVQVQHELFEDAVHVFQTFPFLDMTREAFLSCRNFVRHVLPLHQRQSPQVLDGRSETELENETGNEQSKVVRGDGLEESPKARASTIQDEEPRSASLNDDSASWEYAPYKADVEVQIDSMSGSDTEPDSDKEPRVVENKVAPFPTSSSPPEPQHRAIRRTVSSFARPYQGLAPPPPPRTKKLSLRLSEGRPRKLSAAALPLTFNVAVQPPSPSADGTFPRRSPAVSFTTQQPPAPNIRQARAQSHPDISALCSQWASNGPANKTVTYHT